MFIQESRNLYLISSDVQDFMSRELSFESVISYSHLIIIALHSKTKYNDALSIYSNLILFLYFHLTTYCISVVSGGKGLDHLVMYVSESSDGYGCG